MTYTLVLLRHGESEWNAKNLFTGWVDVALSEKGVEEAKRGGTLLTDAGVLPDVVHTSLLRRAITTANLALDAADRHWIPVKRSWRLNERHYGALQGKDKKQTLDEYGEEQFMLWRRSYDFPPPDIELGSEFSQDTDPRYAGEPIPRAEALDQVLARALPYWESDIVPDLQAGKTVLVAAHGNSIRALVKHLDDVDSGTIAGINIPTGIPLLYTLDEDDAEAHQPGRHLPRPGGGRGGHQGRRQPGPLAPSRRPNSCRLRPAAVRTLLLRGTRERRARLGRARRADVPVRRSRARHDSALGHARRERQLLRRSSSVAALVRCCRSRGRPAIPSKRRSAHP